MPPTFKTTFSISPTVATPVPAIVSFSARLTEAPSSGFSMPQTTCCSLSGEASALRRQAAAQDHCRCKRQHKPSKAA